MDTQPVTRAALPTDLPFVFSGELDYIRTIEPTQETSWKNGMRSHLVQWTGNLDRMFILEIDGELIGYCFWQIDDQTAVLASIYVKPEQRRKGLGLLLLKRYITDASLRGFGQFGLGVHVNNPVRPMYETAGFTWTRDEGDYSHYELFVAPAST